MKMITFWDTAPCSLLEVYRRFGGEYCLHHQGDPMIMVAVRTRETSVNEITRRNILKCILVRGSILDNMTVG